MGRLGRLAYLRPCVPADDAFLYDVFCTTWASEVAALPNPRLAPHVLRIQHIAQERQFASRHPGHQRYVVLHDDEPAGRLFVHERRSSMHVVDLTLLPRFRGWGLGAGLTRDLLADATEHGRSVTIRLARRNVRACDLYSSLGFRLAQADDVDSYFEWTPPAIDAPGDLLCAPQWA
jgi:GNAT superfamily N-acetyltransferase